jgi:hypothetical protein
MAVTREDQAVVAKQTTVATPTTLGFADCLALILGLILMLIAAAFPDADREP